MKQVTQIGLPTLMNALNKNASTPQGAEALAGALDQHKDANMDDVSSILGSFKKNKPKKDNYRIP